jgi:hypothetical protein
MEGGLRGFFEFRGHRQNKKSGWAAFPVQFYPVKTFGKVARPFFSNEYKF